MSDEQKLERKVITNQMSQFLSDQKAIYLASLQQIHDSIRTPPLLSFIQDLATNRDFCSAFTCYKQTNFLYEDETLHVTTQKHTVTLQEQVLLTCSLLHENMVGIYHNTQCTTDGLVFQPIDSSIPPLPVSSLDPIEHNIPRRTAPSDLINGNIIVLYNQDQQAFQCMNPAKLLIDGKDIVCDNQTLSWIKKPNQVIDVETGERILEHRHFKSSHIMWDLQTSVPTRDISHLLLQPFNKSLIHDVKTFFNSVDKLHGSAFSSAAIFLILTLCLSCAVSVVLDRSSVVQSIASTPPTEETD